MIQPSGSWLRIKLIEFNSSWRKLLFPILRRESGVSSSVVDAECWRSRINWHNPVCDLYVLKLGFCGLVKTKIDFFNTQLWKNLNLRVFARADESFQEGTENEIPIYFLFHTFCHYVPHGDSQAPRCWGLTPLLTHAFPAGWQISITECEHPIKIMSWTTTWTLCEFNGSDDNAL